MNKYYRKIIVDNKEYDWLYLKSTLIGNTDSVYDFIKMLNKREYIRNIIMLFDVYYEKNKAFDTNVRKRKFIKSFQVDKTVTPKNIKYLIIFGYIPSNQELRKEKLKKLQ